MTNNNGIGKTIQPIFAPAISVLNRINYTRKFTLLWLMSSVAIAVVTYSLFVSLDRVIQPSQRELQGLVLIEPVYRTVQRIQLHRGLSAALLGGNETMKDRRAAQEREAAEAFEAMEGKLPPSLTSSKDFRNIKSSWEALRKEGLHWVADENFAAHTRLIEQFQSFEVSIADDYALILDAELDTYYLIDTNVNKLPHVLEHLGRLRAYGTGILARKQITERQKIKLNNLIAGLDSVLNELSVNIEKAGRYSPAVRESLLAAYEGIADSARQITGLVASDILTGRFATPPDVFLDMATAEIDNGYTQMYESLLPTTKALIEARIARAEKTLLVTVSIAVLLFLLVVYLSVSIYYAIIGSIRSLVRSAHTFAEGDLSRRVKLDTRDELSRIGDSFNKMADGFNALLEARKQAEESLEQESYRNKMLLRTASDGIHILDIDGNVVQVNDAFCRMLGYTATEMLSMNAAQWDAQWTTEQIKANIDMLDSNASMIETMHRRRDGSIIDVEISVVKVNIDGQQLVYCSSRDVTKRKQAEKALLDKEHLLSESQRIAHIGSWRSDLTGHISWTDETYHIYRVLPDTFTPNAESFFNLIHPDDRPAMRAWVDACAAGRKHGDLEFRINMSDGTVRFLSGRGELQYDAENRPSHMTGTVQDITERKQAEDSLRKLSLAVEQSPNSIVITDLDAIIEYVNESFVRTSGYSRADLIGQNPRILQSGKNQKAIYDDLWAQLIRGEVWHGELINRRKDGREYIEEEIISPVRQADGRVTHYLAIKEDITERKQAEQSLIASKEKLHAVIETALDAVVQMDTAGIITGWNAQAEKIFGWTREEAIGLALGETIVPPQYREAHKQGIKRFLATGEGPILNSRVEFSALYRDGHEFPVELAVTSVKTADKHEFSAFIRDITDRKKSEDMIWKQANFDTLTGLPNRHMFYDRLAQEIKKAGRADLSMALLYIDLDRFKEVNDTLGHSMGDILLVEAARRNGECVRETDTVARLGGDEFIVILTELNEVSRVDALAQNILHELAEPFRLESEVIYLSASIGITLYPHDAAGMEELVKNADQAMYAAKNAGRNRSSYFTQSMQQTAQAKLRLINDLRGALATSQFRVYYQPIMELATGRIHKAEALIRWQHPAHGMVSPADFIPLAEETGMIVEIGDWVFREAARQAKRWGALCGHEFQISVNMSPVQFHSADSPCQAWPAYLRELGLPGQSIVIEITEGLLLNEEIGVKDKLLRFHGGGIQISLDDFGTGYSSLSYLQKFDIDYLKIDQSFTRALEPGSKNMALSEAVIVMAHKLGMKVIAEGIETEMQRTLLAAAGCDYGQGYLFSRPVPAGELEELFKSGLTRGYQAQ